MSKSFGDYATTAEFLDTIRDIVQDELRASRPTARYAEVVTIDTASRSCMVKFNGDTTLSKVPYRSQAPAAVGQIVAVEGSGIDQYIADVMGNTSTDVSVAAVNSRMSFLLHMIRTQNTFIGGGSRQASTTGVAWTEPFYFISAGRTSAFQSAAFYSIAMPTSGTVVGIGGAANRNAASTGIALGDWEALYAIIPTGSSTSALTVADLRVVSYTQETLLPDNAALIAIRYGGTNKAVTWADGITIRPGFNTDDYFADVQLQANTGLLAANSEAYAQGGWAALRNVGNIYKSAATSGTGSGYDRFILPVAGRWEMRFKCFLDMGAFDTFGSCKMAINGRTPTTNTFALDHRLAISGAFGRSGAHVLLEATATDSFGINDVIYWSVWGSAQFTVQKNGMGASKTQITCRYLGFS